MFQYGMGGVPRPRRTFEQHYQCYSMAMIDKSNLDDGDKIILPTSALNILSRMEIEYPMLFEVRNDVLNRKTHCGVIEFIAEEGRCHLPCHMMNHLLVEEGSLISIRNVSLPKATFLKVRAQSVDFLDISNPRAVLEYTLRKYTCVTVGDVIVLSHLGKLFHMDVQEVRPNGAASIVETDVEIDFDEPLGYKESEYAKYEKKGSGEGSTSNSGSVIKPQQLQKARIETSEADSAPKFVPFAGTGKRIDGKSTSSSNNTPMTSGKLDSKEGDSMNIEGTKDSTANATIAARTSQRTVATSSQKAFASQGMTISSATSSSSADSKTSSKLSSSSSSDISAGIATVNGNSNTSQPTPPQYQSRIGDKFSKKKVNVSAFTGPANKLA